MKQIILQGHDVPVDFILKSSDGTVIQPNSLSQILIILYYEVGGQILSKFSKTSLSGYTLLSVEDNALGKIRVIVPSDTTKIAKAGTIRAEVKIKAADSDMADAILDQGVKDLYCFDINESRLKNA